MVFFSIGQNGRVSSFPSLTNSVLHWRNTKHWPSHDLAASCLHTLLESDRIGVAPFSTALQYLRQP